MKSTLSPVVSKIDNWLEQYTSAAQVGMRGGSVLMHVYCETKSRCR